MRAPEIALTDLEGRSSALRDLRGKVVILNFWASWCVPCRNEVPALERLYRTYREHGLVVIAVNSGESAEQVRRFLEQLQVTFLTAMDSDGTTTRRFAVRGLPATFLLDREGWIVGVAVGWREWDGPHARFYLERVLRGKQP